MNDAPQLIGRNRAPQRVHGLGQAVPVMGGGRYRPGDPVAPVPRTAEEMREAERERRDSQHVITGCALCETWSFDGTAVEGRELARAHRAEAHPEMKQTRTRRDNLIGWKNNNPEQRAEAMKIVEQRRAFNTRSEGRLKEAAAAGTRDGHAASSSRRLGPAQQSIVAFLADGPKRLYEIAEHQGTKMATNGKTLQRLSELGVIVKQGHGVYALADVVQEKAA